MVDPRQRSKRRYSGSSARPLKNPTLYLDESFDCAEVKRVLDQGGIKYKIYSQHFTSGSEDAAILRLAGKRSWLYLTCDTKNRYRGLEREAVKRHKVRQFIFSGNLGGIPLATLLVRLKVKMRNFCRNHERPFVAKITNSGDIHLLMDKDGNLHGRKESHG